MKSRLTIIALASAACHLAAAVELAKEQDSPGLGLQLFTDNTQQPEYVDAPADCGATNLTHPVEVVSAEARTEKTPHVRFVLKNLSTKKVMALKLEILKDGRTLSTGWPLGTEGRALLEPGVVYEAHPG